MKAIPKLPHAGAMHWLDEATLSEDGRTVTAVRSIGAGHPFVAEGFFLASGLIELMAQTAAAGAILRGELTGKRIRRGVLAAVREMRVLLAVAAGATVIVTGIDEKTFGPFTSARLEARVQGELVARGRMTFHLQFE